MMEKFTKEEWMIDGLTVYAINQEMVNQFSTNVQGNFKYGASSEELEANAHLIAAAPEMYDLLSTIENDSNQVPEWLWEKIQKTLAKARGEL